MNSNERIFVAGHRGLVGSAIVRCLRHQGYYNIITRTKEELNLLNQPAVASFFAEQKIDICIIAAAKVGGILFNRSYQADFLYENVMISANVIHAAAENNVRKLIYLGSSCIYPKFAPQPIKEESLLTGPLEPTNEGYAIAKIAGLKLCEKYREQYGKDFISIQPTNLYGPGDNFHPEQSHVIPGLLRRFHEAVQEGKNEVTIWGTGTPMREFLYVDDLAEAIMCVLDNYSDSAPINIGTGEDCSIRELAETIAQVTGFKGVLQFDSSKPDGTPRKVLDVHKVLSLGWSPKYTLRTGLEKTYEWILANDIFGHPPAVAV